jgi:hypothetical protein
MDSVTIEILVLTDLQPTSRSIRMIRPKGQGEYETRGAEPDPRAWSWLESRHRMYLPLLVR